MIIGIHPDRSGDESYSEKWAAGLRSRGVEVRELDLLAPNALDQARGCDGVMWRWRHHAQDKQSAQRILFAVEHLLGIPVYPDTPTAWHYDEKVAQLYLLRALGALMPQTWLFWEREAALKWCQAARYPLVFKLSSGASSANILKVDSAGRACGLVEQMFGRGMFPYSMNEFATRPEMLWAGRGWRALASRLRWAWGYAWRREYPPLPSHWRAERGYVYFQEFVPGNAFDTRVAIIGGRAFALRRFNRPGDFRASGSGRLDHDPKAIDPRCLRSAFDLSRRGRFQSMAYDFLVREGQPVITEISYAFADSAVHDCPGHWDEDLNWVPGQMWPQDAQAEDFLERLTRRAASSSRPVAGA